MQNAITTLRIQNFKSIKDVTMTPRRVNIIIGEPNVGKSNILEALSLLGGMVYEQTNKFMGSFIRYNQPRQLFYDNLSDNTIKVETNKDVCLVGRSKIDNNFKYLLMQKTFYDKQRDMKEFNRSHEFTYGDEDVSRLDDFAQFAKHKEHPLTRVAGYLYTEFDNVGNFGTEDKPKGLNTELRYFSSISVRAYLFLKKTLIDSEFNKYLHPPYGDNLILMIQKLPNLRQEITDFFKPHNLKVQLRVDEKILEIVKDLNGFIYSYPYSSTADTLQRLIFYLAAIESNDDAVLLFEEPEAHSFPSYVMHLAQSIVHSRNNQFFVVTHNPYLLTEILEEMLTDDELKPELAIFTAYYEDYQTKVYQLTDNEMVAARADGLDFFLNLRRFVPEAD